MDLGGYRFRPVCSVSLTPSNMAGVFLLHKAIPYPPPKRELLALRFTQLSAKFPTLAAVFGRLCSFNACSFDCKPSGIMSGRRFPVQRYCGREERQVPPALSAGGLDGSLPQISACLGILGIPSAPSRLTLVLSSHLSAVELRTKNGFPGHEAPKGFTKGKRIETNNIQNIGLCV